MLLQCVMIEMLTHNALWKVKSDIFHSKLHHIIAICKADPAWLTLARREAFFWGKVH